MLTKTINKLKQERQKIKYNHESEDLIIHAPNEYEVKTMKTKKKRTLTSSIRRVAL